MTVGSTSSEGVIANTNDLEKKVSATADEKSLDFTRRYKDITLTVEVEKLLEITEKIGLNIMSKKESRSIGYGYIKVNDEGIGEIIGIVWKCRRDIDDLDKAAKKVFKDHIIQIVKRGIYLANIEGENVMLKCE